MFFSVAESLVCLIGAGKNLAMSDKLHGWLASQLVARGWVAASSFGTAMPPRATPTVADAAVTYAAFVLTGLLLYSALATASFLYYYCWRRGDCWPQTLPPPHSDAFRRQVRREVAATFRNFPVVAALLMPIVLGIRYGWSRAYLVSNGAADSASTTQRATMAVATCALFVAFTDTLVYWAHRALHHRWLYPFHKLHHRYEFTTPFSALAFHPIDGFLQAAPNFLFAYAVPVELPVLEALILLINVWVVLLHDQMDWRGGRLRAVVNSAGHHTLHHERYHVNYGQFTTAWDRIGGTYETPVDARRKYGLQAK